MVTIDNLLPASLSFLSIGFSLLTTLPRLQSIIQKELDHELTENNGIIPSRKYLSQIYYLKIIRFMDFIAFLYLVGGFLIILTPIHLYNSFDYHTYLFLVFCVATTICRMIYAAYLALIETLKYSLISPHLTVPLKP